MTFERLLWLFPIALTLHNAEEAIWMPSWQVRHAGQLPIHPPGAVQIRVLLVLLTVAAYAVTWLSVRRGPGSVWVYLTFGYIVAVLVNVLVPHVPAAIAFRGYAPGVVTAVLINLPLMSVLIVGAVRERWVSGWKAVGFGVGVPLAGGALIALWLMQTS